MAAVLSADMDSTDKVVNFVEESRALGLAIAPPHVNECVRRFSAAGERSVRYGLGAIKGVGEAATESVIEERERNGPYTDSLRFHPPHRSEAGQPARRRSPHPGRSARWAGAFPLVDDADPHQCPAGRRTARPQHLGPARTTCSAARLPATSAARSPAASPALSPATTPNPDSRLGWSGRRRSASRARRRPSAST